METKSKLSLSNKWNVVAQYYKLEKYLGEGSFGQVVKVSSHATGKSYAVKRI